MASSLVGFRGASTDNLSVTEACNRNFERATTRGGRRHNNLLGKARKRRCFFGGAHMGDVVNGGGDHFEKCWNLETSFFTIRIC